jgi:hypothetical protein
MKVQYWKKRKKIKRGNKIVLEEKPKMEIKMIFKVIWIKEIKNSSIGEGLNSTLSKVGLEVKCKWKKQKFMKSINPKIVNVRFSAKCQWDQQKFVSKMNPTLSNAEFNAKFK